MRNIRFRGVGIDSGEFVYGGYIVSSGRFGPIHQIHIASEDLEDEDMFVTVDAQTIGQLTGLPDKNGADIYESDLVRIPAISQYEETTYNCFEVFYHDNECIGGQNIGFCINRMHTQGNSAGGIGFKFTPESMKDFEIIGNIHENKELLAQGG